VGTKSVRRYPPEADSTVRLFDRGEKRAGKGDVVRVFRIWFPRKSHRGERVIRFLLETYWGTRPSLRCRRTSLLNPIAPWLGSWFPPLPGPPSDALPHPSVVAHGKCSMRNSDCRRSETFARRRCCRACAVFLRRPADGSSQRLCGNIICIHNGRRTILFTISTHSKVTVTQYRHCSEGPQCWQHFSVVNYRAEAESTCGFRDGEAKE